MSWTMIPFIIYFLGFSRVTFPLVTLDKIFLTNMKPLLFSELWKYDSVLEARPAKSDGIEAQRY